MFRHTRARAYTHTFVFFITSFRVMIIKIIIVLLAEVPVIKVIIILFSV